MSATLCWKPTTQAQGHLPDELKFILRTSSLLRQKVDGCDSIFTADRWRPYFIGLADAKVEGAQEVLDLLDKYGEIILWLEY